MFHPEALLADALRSGINDVREQYLFLAALSPEQRTVAVADSGKTMDAIREEISGLDVTKAKRALLSYHFATVFIYLEDDRCVGQFVERLATIGKLAGSQVGEWKWSHPSESEFLRVSLDLLAQADFYDQVNMLVGSYSLIAMPSDSEAFHAWIIRCGLTEAKWSWKYQQEVEREQRRWFRSGARLQSTLQAWEGHRVRARACIAKVEPFFLEIGPAVIKLQELKRRQLYHGGRHYSLTRAAEALEDGVQLKHLLLDEACGADETYRSLFR